MRRATCRRRASATSHFGLRMADFGLRIGALRIAARRIDRQLRRLRRQLGVDSGFSYWRIMQSNDDWNPARISTRLAIKPRSATVIDAFEVASFLPPGGP